MAEIFKHTDDTGDSVRVDGFNDGEVVASSRRAGGFGVTVHLEAAAVDRLRAALAPYGTKSEAVKPATDIVEGREYRLVPGATIRVLGGERQAGIVSTGATRVRVDYGPDSYGDFSVTALDGTDANNPGWFVNPKYLAPLTDEAPTEAQPASLDPRWMAALRLARELRPTDSATGLRDFARMVLAEVTR